MRTDNKFLRLVLVLSVAGILVSGWLLSIHIRFATGQAGLTETCTFITAASVTQGCASVAVSDYSWVAGFPLASIAMSFYVSLMLLIIWCMRNYQIAYEALYVSYFLSTVSIVMTVIMFSISRFVLNSFCIGCAMLWVINLLIWPCIVKHLNLPWSSALFELLELVRPSKLNLQRKRLVNSFMLAIFSLVVCAIIGKTTHAFQKEEAGESSRPSTILADFQMAPTVSLPPEAFGGSQSKGVKESTPIMEIVEFSDLQCPACKMAAKFFRPFYLKYGDKIRITYRNFPLDGSCNPFVPNGRHLFACAAAKAGICAADQNKFWLFHDTIFDNQENLSNAMIRETAEKLGLDMAIYDKCIDSPDTMARLQKDMQWGESIGLESTPTIIINGKKFAGARSPSDLELLLNSIQSFH